MKKRPHVWPLILVAVTATYGPAFAQDEALPEETEAPADDAALLTDAELQTLVAPVALYPDTLLIQILVAATVPLDIVKSERFLDANPDVAPESLKDDIEDQGWDPSVAVLATAFPDVIVDMADHIEWTETMGDAMLAQDDDVLAAIQVMRQQAIDSGALISGDAQTVEVVEDETVVIQPTDPEVVYVPQYEPDVVYGGTDVSDVLIAGAIGFGTFALIDAIFDDDDDWNDYWGCRNCGGWGGGPIIRNPNIDLDVDGNVNVGNSVGNGSIAGSIDRDKIEWKPDPDKSTEARDKIANRRDDAGATKLPIKKPDTGTDALRDRLSDKANVQDIAKGGAAAGLGAAAINRAGAGSAGRDLRSVGNGNRPEAAAKAEALRKTGGGNAIKKPAAVKKATVARKPTANVGGANRQNALKKRSGGGKASLASKRGGGAKKRLKR
ncbi:DUF3300 domain-containing protein [Meridianimarinicoccus aquatilis]|uniref:DUF3300 domain-containing protein n=1 Tax=Meridianimarinicoccus aquatilis TaxID=2552766 RepID=UPI0014051883|nr:DUF3300 domain-containing protein [Fluviibacterium aquatile]